MGSKSAWMLRCEAELSDVSCFVAFSLCLSALVFVPYPADDAFSCNWKSAPDMLLVLSALPANILVADGLRAISFDIFGTLIDQIKLKKRSTPRKKIGPPPATGR